jgi:hypothetical protein
MQIKAARRNLVIRMRMPQDLIIFIMFDDATSSSSDGSSYSSSASMQQLDALLYEL